MSELKQLLVFENITIRRGELTVLENINFTLHNAELIFILGDSGSGKSTFLKSLYGAIDIEGESAKILGHDLLEIRRKDLQLLRRELGMVFQDYKIFEKLSVFENLNYFLKSINVKDDRLRNHDIEDMLEKVGLQEYRDKKAYELSGGEKQRLAIARALVHKPKIIIADEPTGNLNQELGITVFKLLRALALEQGTSIITATHDENLPQIFSAKVFRAHSKGLHRI